MKPTSKQCDSNNNVYVFDDIYDHTITISDDLVNRYNIKMTAPLSVTTIRMFALIAIDDEKRKLSDQELSRLVSWHLEDEMNEYIRVPASVFLK